MRRRKIQKIRHFLGPVDRSLPPLFLNSMPKAGTNLVEKFLVLAGYRREFARCLTEQNINNDQISMHRGRFHIGHLCEDSMIHTAGRKTIFVRRDLWACVRSYVNFLFLDKAHPASAFVRNGFKSKNETNCIERLIFSDQNPLGRSVLSEYQRFFDIDEALYDLVVDFKEFKKVSPRIVESLSGILETNRTATQNLMLSAIEAQTWTMNSGTVDVFNCLDRTYVNDCRSRVKAADKWVEGLQ